MIKECRLDDNKIKNMKLFIPWRPAVHIIYSATRIKDHETEVSIFAESSYEFLRCFANQKRTKVNKDGVGWLEISIKVEIM